MSIQTTVGQIASAVDGKALAKIEEGLPPVRYRFACAKFCAAVREEYQRYAQLRDRLVREYGIADKDKHTISVAHPSNPPERVAAFNDKMKELLDSSVELLLEPLSAAKLGDTVSLTIGDLELLGPLIVET